MTKPYNILVGDTDTPSVRVPRTGEQAYRAPVTLSGSAGVEVAFDVQVDIAQTLTAGFTADRVEVLPSTVGTGTALLLDRLVDGDSKFSVDASGVVATPYAHIAAGVMTLGDGGEGSNYLVRMGNYGASSYIDYTGGTSVSDGGAIRLHGGSPLANKAVEIRRNAAVIASFGDEGVVLEGSPIRPDTASGPMWTAGAGSPEGNLTAHIGSMYTRTDGGASTTLYVKESGVFTNTGWVAK